MKWFELKVGTKFIGFNNKIFKKEKDTGYFFGICNTTNESGEWSQYPVDAEVTPLEEQTCLNG